MPNLLQRGASWLADKLHDQESVSVTYRRGSDSVVVNATLGSQLLRVQDGRGNTKVERTERDFIIRAADLVLSGVVVTPNRGDTVDLTFGGVIERFEVTATGGEPHARYADPYETRWRIHAKFIAKGPTPPSQNLAAAGGTGQVVLTWTVPATLPGQSYEVQRSPDNLTWTTIPVSLPTYTETAQSGTGFTGAWYFRVRTLSVFGASAYTAAVRASPFLLWDNFTHAPETDNYFSIQNWPDVRAVTGYAPNYLCWRFRRNPLKPTQYADDGLGCYVTTSGLRLKSDAGNHSLLHVWNLGRADHTINFPFTFNGSGTAQVGPAVRVQDDNNFWIAETVTGDSTFRVFKCTAGTFVQQGGSQSITLVAGRAYNATMTSTATQVIATLTDTVTLVTVSITVTDATFYGATEAGHFCSSNTNPPFVGLTTATSPSGDAPAAPAPPAVATLYTSDTFTGADGTAITAHAVSPTNVNGAAWASATNGSPGGANAIQGNALRISGQRDFGVYSSLPGSGVATKIKVEADLTTHPTIGTNVTLAAANGVTQLVQAQLNTFPDNAWIGKPLGQFVLVELPVVQPNGSNDANFLAHAFYPVVPGVSNHVEVYVDNTVNPSPYWAYVDGTLVSYGKCRQQQNLAGAVILKGGDQPTGSGTAYVTADNLKVMGP